MNSLLEKIRPAVGKRVLIILSGTFWIAAGGVLLSFAGRWLATGSTVTDGLICAVGLAGALVIHRFGFLKVVNKNLDRIASMEGKKCLFAFQSWKSYLIVAVMMGMGITLRHSPVPRPYLATLYLSIGLALVLSSIRYLRVGLSGA